MLLVLAFEAVHNARWRLSPNLAAPFSFEWARAALHEMHGPGQRVSQISAEMLAEKKVQAVTCSRDGA